MPTAETIERVNNAYARRLQREYDAEAALEDERRQRRHIREGKEAAANGDVSTELEDRPPPTAPHVAEVDVDDDDGPSPSAPPISPPRSPPSHGQDDSGDTVGASAAIARADDGRPPTKPVVEEYLVDEARERASFDARLAMRMHRDYLKEKKADREAERVRRFSLGSSLSGDSWSDLHALESSAADVEGDGGGRHVQTPVARRTGARVTTQGSHEDTKGGGNWRWWAIVVLRSVVAAIAAGVAVGFTARYFLF